MKPTLFILAAGMGSRYGGLKQLDGLGPNGETIMDYSVFDALRGGFGKVVFVIRKDFEADFREKVLSKYEGVVPVEVVFQSVDKLPEGFTCPADRTKPWGTTQAVLMGAEAIKEPFAVINADDFYGRDSFEVLARDLMRPRTRKGDYSMVGFRVGNTMTEHGSVSRGICKTNAEGYLTNVEERTDVRYNEEHQIISDNAEGVAEVFAPTTPVSMNMWGFTPDFFELGRERFIDFLKANLEVPKAEFPLPPCIEPLIIDGKVTVKVLDTDSRWFGVTYSADRPAVVAKFAELHAAGEYPS
ncbi:MAG: nucleotidyltransferase, partial [Muribaculaceae bacterium]|nr:nucleotidyltransferase [Muribaculaceae bacterium]